MLKLFGDIDDSYIREAHVKPLQRVGIRSLLIAAITTVLIVLAILNICDIRKSSNLQDDGETQLADSSVSTSHNKPVNSITNNDFDEVQDVTPNAHESVKMKDEKQKEISADEVKESVYNELLSENIWKYFVFSRGSLLIMDSGTERLSLVFVSDKEGASNEVRVSITQVADTDFYAGRLVNADEVDKYDICNYDVPYSQSIPESLKFTLEEPIFQYEDFCKEIILYRATNIQESNEEYYNIRVAIEIDGYVVDYMFKVETLDGIYQIFI